MDGDHITPTDSPLVCVSPVIIVWPCLANRLWRWHVVRHHQSIWLSSGSGPHHTSGFTLVCVSPTTIVWHCVATRLCRCHVVQHHQRIWLNSRMGNHHHSYCLSMTISVVVHCMVMVNGDCEGTVWSPGSGEVCCATYPRVSGWLVCFDMTIPAVMRSVVMLNSEYDGTVWPPGLLCDLLQSVWLGIVLRHHHHNCCALGGWWDVYHFKSTWKKY